ncbi:MAG: hypothetical protein ACO1N3_02345 [Gammaproteobacteria bacterium]
MSTATKIKAIWAEHTKCEFELRDAEATMATMTDNPHVNHVPTLMGGIGYDAVYQFYKQQFIPTIPTDYDIKTISCTVDEERLIEEQIFRFVHNCPVNFILPKVEPTGKTIILPLVVIVHIQHEKVASEHIYWDQATVLKQLGWLDDKNWPVTGAEQAHSLDGEL